MATPSWLPKDSGNVRVRALQKSDLSALFDLESDPFLKKYIIGGPITATKETWVSNSTLCSSDIFFAIEHIPTGKFAGRVALGHFKRASDRTNRELQIIVTKDFVGTGFGKSVSVFVCNLAFEYFDATKVFAEVHPNHPRSPQLLRELGFTEVTEQFNTTGALECRIYELSQEKSIMANR